MLATPVGPGSASGTHGPHRTESGMTGKPLTCGVHRCVAGAVTAGGADCRTCERRGATLVRKTRGRGGAARPHSCQGDGRHGLSFADDHSDKYLFRSGLPGIRNGVPFPCRGPLAVQATCFAAKMHREFDPLIAPSAAGFAFPTTLSVVQANSLLPLKHVGTAAPCWLRGYLRTDGRTKA